MEEKLTKEDCIILIKNKFNENNELPKKSDFTDWQVMMIKSHLGPWPRALEKAGVTVTQTNSYSSSVPAEKIISKTRETKKSKGKKSSVQEKL